MTEDQDIARLIIKQLRQELSAGERIRLEAWINESPSHQLFMEKYAELHKMRADLIRLMEMDDAALDGKLAERLKKEATGKVPVAPRFIRAKLMYAAAMFAIVMGLVLFISYSHSNISREKEVMNFDGVPSGKALALPGSNSCLILPDGGRLVLKRLEIGKTFKKDGWMILRTGENAIACFPMPGAKEENRTIDPGFHTLSVSYGESWQVALPDGSKVQVGAGSTLAFRISSSSDLSLRLASLRGEAYFEIAPDTRSPFSIRTASGVISVLGTSFNVRDYADQDGCRATLLQGAIKVQYKGGSKVLRPGEQAWISQTIKSGCVIKAADTAASVAWRSPYFDITNKRIPDIMHQLISWYGYEGYILHEGIDSISEGLLGGGHISKDLSLKELLGELNRHSDLDFRIKECTILVRKK